MRYVSCLMLLVASSAMLWSAPPEISGPEKVYGEVGDWVEIKVQTDGKQVVFLPLEPGLKMFPANKLKDPYATLVHASEAKRYRVLCYTGNADGPSVPFIVTVTFGSPPADDDSKPKPAPVDQLTKDIRDAYAAEAAPDKRERARAFAEVMKRGAKLADDSTLLTNDVIAARVSKDTKESIGDSLPGVRKAIGKYLASKLPADVVNLTPEMRAIFRDAYTKAAAALVSVSQ